MSQERKRPDPKRSHRTANRFPRTKRSSFSLTDGLPTAIGGILRTTWEQMGAVREVVEQTARSSRLRVDAMMAAKNHRDALMALGAACYERAVRGDFGDLNDDHELLDLLAAVEHAEAETTVSGGPNGMNSPDLADFGFTAGDMEDLSGIAGDSESDLVSAENWQPPAPPSEPMRVWRPVIPNDPPNEPTESAPQAPLEDAPVKTAANRARGTIENNRPPGDVGDVGDVVFVMDSATSGGARDNTGYVDDEDDLAEYMHEDDVPHHEGKSRQ